MSPTSLVLLAVFLHAAEGQNFAVRTFTSNRHSHSHAGLPADHNLGVQAHGHHSHAQPTDQHTHAGYVHRPHANGHQQGNIPGSAAHQHQFNPPHSAMLGLLYHGQGHQHPNNNQHSSVSTQVPSNGNMVSVMVCNIAQVPVVKPASPVLPKADSSSSSSSGSPQHVFRNITSSIGNVVSRVINPVVSLLHNASVWFNRTAHREQSHNAQHHQHNFTVLNHTGNRDQGHDAHHHSQHNFTVDKADVVRKKFAALTKLSRNQTHPSSMTARPAIITEATTTSGPALIVTSVVPDTEITTRANPSTVPVLTSTLGANASSLSLHIVRSRSSTILGPVTAWTDGLSLIPEKCTPEIYDATSNANFTMPASAAHYTVLPTTSVNVSLSQPEDQVQGTTAA
ncbi:uncharacterized protein [Dermacentor andersoni]|uniref:uncharacterized protein n=1 Tax=Dermacentor andersoni TaxID=34620 RepID=UPI002415BFB6|nr:uncharacterized protein LOC129386441 [Dermacentor andersoni]